MSYLGSSASPVPVAFSGPQSEPFNGGASVYTLSRAVSKVTDIEVMVNNVQQSPYDGSYSVSGKTLTFSETVSAGTANVVVNYRDVTLGTLKPTPGSVGKIENDVANLDGTGAALMPTGTTAQRPGAPVAGMTRFNTTSNTVEVYNGSMWQAMFYAPYTAEALIVAGGGGTGRAGAGAGGLLYYGLETPKTPNGSAISLTSGTSYSIVVGAGGASGGQNNGANSTAFGYTAIGGGGGGTGGGGILGSSGGSGGGQGGTAGGGTYPGAGSGTTGQGNPGGNRVNSNNDMDGGGGGAGASGQDGQSSVAGNGGIGLQYSINGTATYYAGGGAGGAIYQGNGGLGGGGGLSTGNNGAANTGGGASKLGAGGSGVVVIRYFGAQRGTGGTVTSSGGYTIHTFTSSGTFTA